MFKLLTEEGREKIRHEYILRRIAVILGTVILALIVGVIGLFPSYLLSKIRYNETLERVTIVSKSAQIGEADLELKNWLSETNQRLTLLAPKPETDQPSTFIDQVLKKKVTNVSLKNFTWIKNNDKLDLSINGVALSRQALVAFEEALSSSEYFSDVILPVSDLAKDKDVNFQIKFSRR